MRCPLSLPQCPAAPFVVAVFVGLAVSVFTVADAANVQRVRCPLSLPQRPVAPLDSLAQSRVQTSLGRQGGGGGGR